MVVFAVLALLAIIAGGMLSAFHARHPSRFVMWVTAYLVLIVGMVQLGLVASWQQLGLSVSLPALLGFTVFNVGNVAVMAGRSLKERAPYARNIVYLGGALLAVSILFLGWLTLEAPWSWLHVPFMALTLVILISMPIGLWLTARSSKK